MAQKISIISEENNEKKKSLFYVKLMHLFTLKIYSTNFQQLLFWTSANAYT